MVFQDVLTRRAGCSDASRMQHLSPMPCVAGSNIDRTSENTAVGREVKALLDIRRPESLRYASPTSLSCNRFPLSR